MNDKGSPENTSRIDLSIFKYVIDENDDEYNNDDYNYDYNREFAVAARSNHNANYKDTSVALITGMENKKDGNGMTKLFLRV